MPAKLAPERRIHKRKWFDITLNSEPYSLRHHEFNSRSFIDSRLTFQADANASSKYGPTATYEAAATYAFRTTELIRFAEKERAQMHRQVEQANQELAKSEGLKKDLRGSIKERNTFSQLHQQLKKSHADLKTELQKVKDSAWAAEEANTVIASELENARTSITSLKTDLAAQKSAMDTKIAACKLDAADKYEAGFNAANDQVHIVAPNVDTSKACVWKEIIDGKLVAPSTEE